MVPSRSHIVHRRRDAFQIEPGARVSRNCSERSMVHDTIRLTVLALHGSHVRVRIEKLRTPPAIAAYSSVYVAEGFSLSVTNHLARHSDSSDRRRSRVCDKMIPMALVFFLFTRH